LVGVSAGEEYWFAGLKMNGSALAGRRGAGKDCRKGRRGRGSRRGGRGWARRWGSPDNNLYVMVLQILAIGLLKRGSLPILQNC
jgi:hypothetical protein